MAGRQEKAAPGRRADERRAVGRHRPQSAPETRPGGVAAAREQVADDVLQGAPARLVQRQRVAGELGGAADADAIAQPRHRHLVGLVHHGRFGRARRVDDRQRQRITLDRIDRDAQAERAQQQRRVAAERDHHRVGRQRAGVGLGAAHHTAGVVEQALHRRAEAEVDAERGGPGRQPLGEEKAVAGLVAGQAQAADELVAHRCERRLVHGAAGRVEQLEVDAATAQHRDVGAGRVELRGGAEQLQRALAAFVVGDAGGAAQFAQAVAAVLGQPHHARLVDLVARGGAVAQHGEGPAQQFEVEVRSDDERAVVHQQPLDRLQRHAGPGPRRRVAGRDLAGVGEARLERDALPALDHGHLVAGTGELVGGGDADHAGSEDQHLHRPAP